LSYDSFLSKEGFVAHGIKKASDKRGWMIVSVKVMEDRVEKV
jgi:hypothetical protein